VDGKVERPILVTLVNGDRPNFEVFIINRMINTFLFFYSLPGRASRIIV